MESPLDDDQIVPGHRAPARSSPCADLDPWLMQVSEASSGRTRRGVAGRGVAWRSVAERVDRGRAWHVPLPLSTQRGLPRTISRPTDYG